MMVLLQAELDLEALVSHLSVEEGTTALREEVHGSRCIFRRPHGVLHIHMSS